MNLAGNLVVCLSLSLYQNITNLIVYLRPKVTLHYVNIYFFRVFMRDIRKLFDSY